MSENYKSLLNELDLSTEYLSVDNLIVNNLEPNALSYVNQGKELRSLPLGLGQVAVGQLGGPPLAGYITGTANQVNVDSKSNITLSLPQDIGIASSPTFKHITAQDVTGFVKMGINIRSLGRAELFMNSTSTVRPSDIMFGYGAELDTNKVWWSQGARGSGDSYMYRFYRGPAHTYVPAVPATETTPEVKAVDGTFDPFLEFLKDYIIRPGGNGLIDLGESDRKFKNLYLSGNIIVDGTVDGRDIAADGKKLDGLPSSTSNFVTTDTIQSISATKSFTAINTDWLTCNGILKIISSSRRCLDLSNGGNHHQYNGLAYETNATIIQTNDATSKIKLMAAQSSTTSLTLLEIDKFGVIPAKNANTNLDLGSATNPFKNLYLTAGLSAANIALTGDITMGGSITLDGKVDGRDIAADGKTLDGLVSGMSGYVTTSTTQDISGSKTFTNNFNQQKSTAPTFRLQSSTGTGNATLELQGRSDFPPSKLMSGADGSLEIYSPYSHYFRGPLGIILHIPHNELAILPGYANTVNLGNSVVPFSHLYLGRGDGTIQLGHNVRGDGRAALALFSDGNTPSDIYFGQNARTDANTNWSLGGRSKGADDKYDFQFYRGPANAGGAFQEFITFKGDGTAVNPRTSNVTKLGESDKRWTEVHTSALALPTYSGLTAYNLSGHSRGVFVWNYNGVNGNQLWTDEKHRQIACYYTRTGSDVSLTLVGEAPAPIKNPPTYAYFKFDALPVQLRPLTATRVPIIVQSSTSLVIGNIQILADGTASIYVGTGNGSFVGGLNAGFESFTIPFFAAN